MPNRKEETPESVLASALTLLRRHRIRHLLIGALAFGLWARPRTTLDVDLLISIPPEDLESLTGMARMEGFAVDRRWAEDNPLLRQRQIRLRKGGIAVDIIRAEDRFEENAFRRKKRKRLGKEWVWVASPEDLIIMKLRAGRPRDLEDAVTLYLLHTRSIDESYLFRQARQLGLNEEIRFILNLEKG